MCLMFRCFRLNKTVLAGFITCGLIMFYVNLSTRFPKLVSCPPRFAIQALITAPAVALVVFSGARTNYVRPACRSAFVARFEPLDGLPFVATTRAFTLPNTDCIVNPCFVYPAFFVVTFTAIHRLYRFRYIIVKPSAEHYRDQFVI